MREVVVPSMALDDYRGTVPDDLLDSIAHAAQRLRGAWVIHVNATPAGGGVAEILKSVVPLMRSAGLDARWYVIDPDPAFFQVTKKLHHCLQGGKEWLSDEEMELYLAHNRGEATALESAGGAADLWIVHDPQVLPLLHDLSTNAPAVWVCHLDTTQPDERVRALLLPYIWRYQRVVFSLPDYRLEGMDPERVSIIPPAIDPLAPKNRPLPRGDAREMLARLGLDSSRPLVAQVSRFDQWKDPWGVIDAYRLARAEVPGLQLALVGAMTARDDPDALEVFNSVQRYTGGDPDIHLFSDPRVIGDLEVNAFQSGADVIVQKSIREGFGLTVAEAMWKGTPVIGGDCGGIHLQIRDEETGFLVRDVPTCARRIVELVSDPALARRLGEAGRESVRRNYLIPRLLRDYLELAVQLLQCVPTGFRELAAVTA